MIDFIEKKNYEIKRGYSDSILKTVSAFANYDGGRIIIGIDERKKEVVGVKDYIDSKLTIENKINDTIVPRPDYAVNVIEIDNSHLIEIVVYPSDSQPYLYKGIAYQRKDTSTIPVDQMSLIELSLKGKNITYDQKKVDKNILSFKALERKLMDVRPISEFNEDTLITLGLKVNGGYIVASELFADENSISSSGIDMVKFGSDISTFVDRVTISQRSILILYEEAIKMLLKHYPEIEKVVGFERKKVYPIPYEAFREVIANAIAHRNYLINAYIKVEMYDNRIEVISPGGLPKGISKENFLNDNLSIPRNNVISSVLYNLSIIEKFGTGIRRINREYVKFDKKPYFYIKDNLIKVILPNVLFNDENMKVEVRLKNFIDIKPEFTRDEIEKHLGINKNHAVDLLNNLIKEQRIMKEGNGPNTSYVKKSDF
jgi:ATP-dependent DNA helicase RecG